MLRLLSNTRRHDVTFYPSGRIDISARAARALNLSSGDIIDIAIDGTEYLLYVRMRASSACGSYQAVVHATKSRSRNFRCYSRAICSHMLAANPSQQLRIPFGKVIQHPQYGTMLYLITHLNIPKP
jgi:hypothetical protein